MVVEMVAVQNTIGIITLSPCITICKILVPSSIVDISERNINNDYDENYLQMCSFCKDIESGRFLHKINLN